MCSYSSLCLLIDPVSILASRFAPFKLKLKSFLIIIQNARTGPNGPNPLSQKESKVIIGAKQEFLIS
jgi:hypothetical protein